MSVTVGTPAPLLLPAGEHKFKEVTQLVEISVPIKGEYPEDIPIEGSFDLCPEPGVMLFGTMVQVMFALKLYPNMPAHHRFIISGVEKQEENLVIVGRVVEIVEE